MQTSEKCSSLDKISIFILVFSSLNMNSVMCNKIKRNFYGIHDFKSHNSGNRFAFINHKRKQEPLFFERTNAVNEISSEKIHLHSNSLSTTKGLDLDFSHTGDVLDSFLQRINTIYPGTVWCGMGNSAPNDTAVGVFYATDSCCRSHDKCPDSIPPKESRHGLNNTGIFTRSHCDCDREFYYCLKRTNTFISRKIGMTYFNILKPQCFRREYPIIHCLRRRQDKRCFLYIVNELKQPIWQWFDNKRF